MITYNHTRYNKTTRTAVLTLFSLLSLIFLVCQSCGSIKDDKTSFAIVIDHHTYTHTSDAVDAYKQMLESEGLFVHLLVDDWHAPDDIRAELIRLYHARPKLEGAVFIGDIPVPMIRDAQHLTSAFKMDQQRFPFYRSSVPSDRFYDDFDLEFEYLGNDEEYPLYHYYSLTPESAQKIHTNIYSGRIKPLKNGRDFYQQINDYLRKVVADRGQFNTLNHVLTYAGHGYNSECLVAWGSERIAYREQLPHLFEPGNSYKFMYTHMRDFSKEMILSEIQRPELDMAVMSNHGGVTAQYLDGWPNVSDINRSIVNIKRFLRSRARNADRRSGDVEATMQDFITRHGVPRDWFDGSFDAGVIEEDSIFSASLDIYIPDVEAITSNARFIKFDACFNGAFQQDEYIAGAYVFGNGNTIVAMANSVNVLQDNWPIEMIGLLAEGVRIGNWARHIHYLENHIIGDPTFYFHAETATNWNNKIVLRYNDERFWKRQLNHANPDIQALALTMLHYSGYSGLSDMLYQKFMQSPYGSVRMQALSLLHQHNDANYMKALMASVDDPYELVRRIGVRWMGMSGAEELIPSLVKVHFEDAHSRRVLFNSRNSAAFMPREALHAELERQFNDSYLIHKEQIREWLFGMATARILSDLQTIQDREQEDRRRLSEIRTLRNYTYHFNVPEYVQIALNREEKPEIREAMVEALGWFTHSYNSDLIIDMCRQILDNDTDDDSVRRQALHTLQRLQAFSHS